MLLYDLSHTSHSRARTGVQRVALELRKALGEKTKLREITHDPHQRSWRFLEAWESATLECPPAPAKRRGAYWPLSAQIRGRLRRLTSGPATQYNIPSDAEAFFTPEIFTQRTGRNLLGLFAGLRCPKVALFHDAISLRLPDLTPPGAVSRFPVYMAELHDFDGICALSEDSKASLLGYWDWAGWSNHPEVVVLPPGMDHLPATHHQTNPNHINEGKKSTPPTILCVGSIEGRKNHVTLLEACELLWEAGERFELRLIGMFQRETGQTAMERIRGLQTKGRPLRYDGWISDQGLEQAFEECAFTVYPSLLEGFGFPVWESLLHGKPCICSAHGATGETARGGGCLAIDTRHREPVAKAIRELMHNTSKRESLAREAAARPSPLWSDCADLLLDWIQTLPPGR